MECGIKASLWDGNFCTKTWDSLVLRLLDHIATSASTSKCMVELTITLHRAEKLTNDMP